MPDEAGEFAGQHRLLDRLVLGDWRDASIASLRRYFAATGPAKELFAGRYFERFAGGGDAAAIRDTVTPADVLALGFLNIRLTPAFVVAIIDERAAHLSELLARLPTDLDMHQAPFETYARDGAAFRAWDLIRTAGGTDRWVTANKLLARKRPRLLPVYDSKVRELLGTSGRFWYCLWTWFAGDPDRVTHLRTLRAAAGGIDDISLLRCLDIALWMRATGKGGSAPPYR